MLKLHFKKAVRCDFWRKMQLGSAARSPHFKTAFTVHSRGSAAQSRRGWAKRHMALRYSRSCWSQSCASSLRRPGEFWWPKAQCGSGKRCLDCLVVQHIWPSMFGVWNCKAIWWYNPEICWTIPYWAYCSMPAIIPVSDTWYPNGWEGLCTGSQGVHWRESWC